VAAAKGPAKRAARRTPKRKKADWRPKFLKAFAETGTVIEAAKKAGVGRRTVYDERQRNETFALKWAEIEEWTTEEMEQEARRRAVLGVEEPVFYKGELVSHVSKYSDTLLIFLLKARKPEVYRENVRVEHGGSVNVKVEELDRGIEGLMEELAPGSQA
jgi:hypothetical protein